MNDRAPHGPGAPERTGSRLRLLVRRPGFWIGTIAVVVAGIIAGVRSLGPVVTTTRAARTAIEQHVIASGRVRVVTRIQLSAETSGRVVAMPALEGERVRKGDLLVQIDDAEAAAAVAEAKAAVSQAAARLDGLRRVGAVVAAEASRQADENLAQAAAELRRVEQLAAAGALPASDLEDARRAVEIARARKTAADAERSGTTPEGVESRIAASALRESQARLAAATAALGKTRLLARDEGIVLDRFVEQGDTVRAGDALLEIAVDGETELAIEPDERNLPWIRIGQRAKAAADAYPEETFDAEVSYVAPSVDPRRGSIEVRLRVPDPPGVLRPDMTVSVDLTVAARDGALALPSEAVQSAGTGDPWVLVVEDGRAARRGVTLGLRGEGHTEIVLGLEEGDDVIVAPPPGLEPGDRVRPRRGEG